jgi:hypothetical protein
LTCILSQNCAHDATGHLYVLFCLLTLALAAKLRGLPVYIGIPKWVVEGDLEKVCSMVYLAVLAHLPNFLLKLFYARLHVVLRWQFLGILTCSWHVPPLTDFVSGFICIQGWYTLNQNWMMDWFWSSSRCWRAETYEWRWNLKHISCWTISTLGESNSFSWIC